MPATPVAVALSTAAGVGLEERAAQGAPSVSRGRARELALAALLALACLPALAVMWALIHRQALAGDESQHAFIAWRVASGDVIYRDFLEHHGPLYAWLNAGLIRALALGRDFETIMTLRRLTLGVAAAQLALVAAIGRRVSGTWLAGAAAAAVLSWTWYFQDKITELRPDGVQALLVLGAVWLLLRRIDGAGRVAALAAGAALGLALLTNAKACVSAAAVGAGWLALATLAGRPARGVVEELLLMGLGAIAALAPAGLYLAGAGALGEALYFNLDYNVLVAAQPHPVQERYLHFMLEEQTVFLLAAALGVLALGWRCATTCGAARQRRLLLLSVTALSTVMVSLMMLKLHPHQYLACLPWLSLAIADGATTAAARLPPAAREPAAAALAAVLIASLVPVSLERTPEARMDKLRGQRLLTGIVLRSTRPEEPVLWMGYECSGFVFNPPASYFWSFDASHVAAAEQAFGQELLGRSTLELLERRPPRLILGAGAALPRLEPALVRAIQRGYRRVDPSGCLWVRRRPAG